ncbi:unnamed protein product [Lathyrus sativus]|nr:unnamed protein product [Lathyrus sativus]
MTLSSAAAVCGMNLCRIYWCRFVIWFGGCICVESSPQRRSISCKSPSTGLHLSRSVLGRQASVNIILCSANHSDVPRQFFIPNKLAPSYSNIPYSAFFRKKFFEFQQPSS